MIMDALTVAGSFIGEVASSIVDMAKMEGKKEEEEEEDSGLLYLAKSMARSSTRIIFFSAACVGIVQNAVLTPTAERLIKLMEKIAAKLGKVFSEWVFSLGIKLRSTGDFLLRVWSRVQKTSTWKLLSAMGNVALRLLGEVEDVIERILIWLGKVIIHIGRRLLSFLMASVGKGIRIITDFLDQIMNTLPNTYEYIVSDAEMPILHNLLLNLDSVNESKKEAIKTTPCHW